MIGWDDVYKVVATMAPLYVAMVLGYGSIRWWNMFKPDHCDAINRFNCFFVIPFFNFHFISQVHPYRMNYSFLASDIVTKSVVIVALALWANFAKSGSLDWSLTTFSLSSMNNTLVVGVPLMQAMYGPLGYDILLQAAAIQLSLWLTFLLFGCEFRRTRLIQMSSLLNNNTTTRAAENTNNNNHNNGGVSSIEMDIVGLERGYNPAAAVAAGNSPSLKPLIKAVFIKLSKNPNSYACFLGLVWALISNRWNFHMPCILEDSILIMSKAGSGVAMFTTGLFMASQEKIISCGPVLTVYGLVLRFVVGPATTAMGAALLRLHGEVFKIATVQAALPQAVTSFVYAKEYGIHADVLSTSIIIGTFVSLPVLIGFYAVLDLLYPS
ncbi:unnamed protein product [Cuscuta campestris]|uniref:Auxin efflux carrier component n=1 Tax=Cuscuta campestris TaxID=132261 RepID=A0A484KC23_9ASTE|nr:unnamed protein product [Cuscuta campestris]